MAVGRLLAALMLTSVVLAGCMQKPADGDHPEDPPTDPGPGNGNTSDAPSSQGRQAEFVDCTALISVYFVDRATVGLQLPAGYTPGGLVSPAMAMVNLEYYTCRAIILDNSTVLHNVSQTMLVTFVNAPSEARTPGSVDVFLFEWLTDDRTFHDHMAAFGAPIGMAEIQLDVSDATNAEASVTANGQPWYRTTTYLDTSDEHSGLTGSRKHHYMDEDPAWVFTNETAYRGENLVRDAVTEVSGGFLQEFPWASAGAITGSSQYITYSGHYEAGRLERSS